MAKIQCLSCGGMTDLGNGIEAECPYCGCTVTPRRMSSFVNMSNAEVVQFKHVLSTAETAEPESKILPLGLCYLKMENYELAEKKFKQAIEETPECAEAYFYYTCAMLRGKTLSTISMQEARTASGYLKTAIALDEKFVFPKLLLGLICVEYYLSNDLIPPADGVEILEGLADQNIDGQEFSFFKKMIKTKII